MTDRTLRLIVAQEKRGNGLAETGQDLTRLGQSLKAAIDERKIAAFGQAQRALAEDVINGAKSFDQAEKELKEYGETLGIVEQKGKGAGLSFKSLATGAAVAIGALTAAGIAAKQAWELLEQGAALELASSRFDKLADSIGTTSDALLTKMKAATSGMVSDAQLIAGANEIISLGLADTEDGVVRLSNLVSQLGWDMQTVIMTFANDSKMRLDALGLSVTDVEDRMKKFTDAGMSMGEAFDLAVIEAGEAKLELLGSAADTSAGQMKILETAIANVKNQLLLTAAVKLAPFLASFTGADTAEWRQAALDMAAAATSLDDLQRAATEAQFALEFAWASPFGNMEVVVPVIDDVTKAIMEASTGAMDAKKNIEDMFSGQALVFALEFWEEHRQLIIYNREELLKLHGALFLTPPDRLLTGYELMLRRLREFSTGQEGGLLGNLFGDPGQSLAELRNMLDAAQIELNGMRAEAEAAAAAVDEKRKRRQEFGGFVDFDTAGMGAANAVMLETATNAGAAAEQLFTLAGGSDAAGQALLNAAANARAAQLGEAVAAGLITAKDAAQGLQDFIDGLTLEGLFKMDEPIAGSREVVETAKEEMLRVVEGIGPALEETTTPAMEAISKVDSALKLLDEVTSTPEIDDNFDEAQGRATEFRRYWDENLAAGLSTTATVHWVTDGVPPPGVPPPGGGGGGGGGTPPPDSGTNSMPPFTNNMVTNQMFNFMNGWSPAQMFAAAQAAAHGLGSSTR